MFAEQSPEEIVLKIFLPDRTDSPRINYRGDGYAFVVERFHCNDRPAALICEVLR